MTETARAAPPPAPPTRPIPQQAPSSPRAAVPVALWVAAFFAVATLHKISLFGPSPFPLNDGALFMAFFQAVADAGLRLPDCVAFNGHCLPLAYPPLAFFVTAALELAGLDALAIAKWYPLAVQSLYSAFGVVLLARVLRPLPGGDTLWLLASVVFLFVFHAYEFLIMGGGITRATGALFWVLALIGAERLCHGVRARPLLGTGLATGAAVLSHPEWGPSAALCVTVLLAMRARDWRTAILATLGTGAVAAAMVAPWLMHVLATHGPGPFADASATSRWSIAQPVAKLISLRIFPDGLELVCAIGAVAALRSGQAVWLVLLLAMQTLLPRSYPSMMPLIAAPVAALGIDWLWRQGAALLVRLRPALAGLGGPRLKSLRQLVLATLLAYGLVVLGRAITDVRETLRQPQPDAVAAMAWAAEHVPPGRRFVMLTGDSWDTDETEEWFALLTPHELISMVRGSEWRPRGVFAERAAATRQFNRTQGCGRILQTLEGAYAQADIVMDILGSRCFEHRPDWHEIFRNDRAVLYRRLPTE